MWARRPKSTRRLIVAPSIVEGATYFTSRGGTVSLWSSRYSFVSTWTLNTTKSNRLPRIQSAVRVLPQSLPEPSNGSTNQLKRQLFWSLQCDWLCPRCGANHLYRPQGSGANCSKASRAPVRFCSDVSRAVKENIGGGGYVRCYLLRRVRNVSEFP